jgi:hypothetical protein
MWTFDGSGWAKLTPTGATPGQRYAAQTVIDPHTNHLLLFGGLRDDQTPAVPPSKTPGERQSFADDMWEWDGATWKQIAPANLPPQRENARMAYDPTRDNIVMFGGYNGAFLSDTWTWNGSTWNIVIFDPLGGRRRVTGGQ